ncbi:ROK family protein [Diaminobutyricibacter sp. McL0608]|uniref:ROK family protein n=1 Tax=Leifsonia sp. McL0608 TaxID=3143537 RepID=UPI0031F2FDC4
MPKTNPERASSQHAVAGDRSLLRRMNLLALLERMMDGPQTITQLADSTGLSRTAVDAIIDDLVPLGWAAAIEPEPRIGAGRPARGFRFRAEVGCVLGMDIGPHKVEVQVSDLAGRGLFVTRTEVAESLGADERLKVAVDLVHAALAGAGMSLDDVWIAAVGTPGVVQNGVIYHDLEMVDWQGLDLASTLRDTLGCHVVVENDVNLAVLAEHWLGVAKEASSIVYVLVGNRTGASIMTAGHLFRGFAGGAGELGALPELGWLHSQEHLSGVVVDGRELSRTEIFQSAAAGAAPAADAVDRFSDAIATGVAAYVLALDPEVVVIGGGVSAAGASFLEPLERHVRKRTITHPEIRLSTLADRSVVLGAVRLALDVVQGRLAAAVTEGSAFPAPSAELLTTAAI